MCQLRQGDILIEQFERSPKEQGSVPDVVSRMTAVVLAAGETSCHAHRLEASGDTSFLWHPNASEPLRIGVAVLEAPAILTHEEHASLSLPPGSWRFVRQRRYDLSTYTRTAAD